MINQPFMNMTWETPATSPPPQISNPTNSSYRQNSLPSANPICCLKYKNGKEVEKPCKPRKYRRKPHIEPRANNIQSRGLRSRRHQFIHKQYIRIQQSILFILREQQLRAEPHATRHFLRRPQRPSQAGPAALASVRPDP